MADLRTLGATSNRVRFTLKDKTTGQGKTGLSTATTGLIISTITDNEASPTVYTVAGSTIETIATLGTFATPTATKCRLKEVSPTNNPGLYEFQFANARFAVAGAKRLVISVNDGQSTILDADYEIQFSNDLVGSILDEVNTGATHNVNNSLGKQVRSLSVNTGVIYTATAPSQAGMTSTQIKLDAGASAIDNVYQWTAISILSGTDAGDSAIITAYDGTTKIATVDPPVAVQPDATSVFEITPTPRVQTVGSSTANVTSVNGTVFSGASVPSILADGVAHGGTLGSSTATLAMQSINVTNPSGDGVKFVSTNAGKTGFVIRGASSGGAAMQVIGGAGGGQAVIFQAGGDADAIAIFGAGGPDGGCGININGGSDGTNHWPAILMTSDHGPALSILPIDGSGVKILSVGSGNKAILLAGDAATDSLAIAAGSGTPIDIFDATGAVRTTGGGGGGSATLDLTQVLSTPRNLGSVADGSLTLNDALHCAVAGAVGKQSISGTTYLVQTPSTGTTLRSFTLDSGTAPRTRT